MASKGLFGGVVDPVYEGLFGGNTDDEDRKSRDALEAAMDIYKNMPDANLGAIDFDDYEWLGDFKGAVDAPVVNAGKDVAYEGYDPRLAALETMGESAFNDVSTDPRLRGQQTAALDSLDEIAISGGMTAADTANLSRIQSDVATADRGRREAIRGNLAAQGRSGGGLELLQMLDSSQAATDRASQAGLDVAGMAQQRALDAIMSGSNLAGSVRGQDFDEQARIAAANDAIDQFNANSTNNMNQFNTGQWNSGQQFNVNNQLQTDMYNRDMNYDANKTNAGYEFDANRINTDYGFQNHQGRQGTADKNVGVANDGKMHNQYTLPQTTWDNTYKKKTGEAGAHTAESDYWSGQAAREKDEAAGRAGLATDIGTTIYSGRKK